MTDPYAELANLLSDALLFVYRSTMPHDSRTATDGVLAEYRPAVVQCYTDHLRIALTAEQATECAEYISRPKPASWDRCESATRIASEKASVDITAALLRLIS